MDMFQALKQYIEARINYDKVLKLMRNMSQTDSKQEEVYKEQMHRTSKFLDSIEGLTFYCSDRQSEMPWSLAEEMLPELSASGKTHSSVSPVFFL